MMASCGPSDAGDPQRRPRSLAVRVIRIGSILAVAYLAAGIILAVCQSRLLYYPERQIDITPEDLNLAYEDVWLTTSDGVKIHGWFVPAAGSKATLLFCHGNAGNISHRLGTLQLFHRLGIAAMIFDYRGYGKSEGKPDEQGTYLDAEAAWDYLTGQKSLPPDRIVLYGRSLGGPIAAQLAKTRNPAALIVDSSFTSVPNRAAEMFPIFPMKLFLRFSYDTRAYLKQIKCPVMIVHSRDDKLMPFKHGQDLFAAAGEPKEFLERRGDHNDGFATSPPSVPQALSRFVTRHAKPGPSR